MKVLWCVLLTPFFGVYGQQRSSGGEVEEPNEIKKVSQLRTSSELGLLIYPNPCQGNFYVKCVEDAIVRVTNMNGQVISEHLSSGLDPLAIINLFPGVYFCTVTKGESTVTSQIISQ
jgi:hypothetical protein